MAKRDWDRPSFKTGGRTTESISGSDVPSEFRTIPPLPRPKTDMRREAEAAMRDFMQRQPAKKAPLSTPTEEKPPWED